MHIPADLRVDYREKEAVMDQNDRKEMGERYATEKVEAYAKGDRWAAEDLLPLVYKNLRALSAKYMRRYPKSTMQPTAVVHEAYLRLVDASRISWQGKTHFFAIAANEMRRILVENARKRMSRKRPPASLRITLSDAHALVREPDIELLALDEALTKLSRLHSRQHHVVEYRFFAGLKVKEIAEILKVSERTVKGDWAVAKAWLRRELNRGRPLHPDDERSADYGSGR